MRKLIFAAATALAITAASASANGMNSCAAFEQLAAAIVTAKQAGIPMSRAMQIVDTYEGDASTRKLLRAVVVDAYRLPDFSSKEFRQRQIIEFQNAIFRACFEQLDQIGALD